MKHHYVPQFLLRAWTEGASDGRLVEFRTDLKGMPSKRKAPAATAFGDGLYAATGTLAPTIDRDAVETQLLQRVDDDAAKVRNRLLTAKVKSLTSAERSAWTRFLMAMRTRQPKMISRFREVGTEEIRRTLAQGPEEYAALRNDEDPGNFEDWVNANFPGMIENFGLKVFGSLVDSELIGNKMIRLNWMRWTFGDVRHELLLSDNPVVFVGGIDAPDLMVAVPLSPSAAFFAVRNGDLTERLRRADPDELVRRLNESVVGQATARVYARSERPRRFVEKLVSKAVTASFTDSAHGQNRS